jgi:hypothetical protein
MQIDKIGEQIKVEKIVRDLQKPHFIKKDVRVARLFI